jgi:hypothetical protein
MTEAKLELVLERVCAIDVAKDSGNVCVQVSSGAGKRVSKVWDVPARSGAAEHLLAEGIEKVTVESTSDYFPHRHNTTRLRKLRRVLRLPTHPGVFSGQNWTSGLSYIIRHVGSHRGWHL